MIQPFGINGLKDEYIKIANDAKQPNPNWTELSKRTISVLSFKMIILCLKGEIIPEVRQQCIECCIDDFYTCVDSIRSKNKLSFNYKKLVNSID